jgi:hypothetical protein
MPAWVDKVWVKVIGAVALAVVSGVISAVTTGVRFYYDTQREIAVLKAELAEVQRDLGIKIASNTQDVNSLKTKSRAHGTQIAQVIKTQTDINGALMGDVPAGSGPMHFTSDQDARFPTAAKRYYEPASPPKQAAKEMEREAPVKAAAPSKAPDKPKG